MLTMLCTTVRQCNWLFPILYPQLHEDLSCITFAMYDVTHPCFSCNGSTINFTLTFVVKTAVKTDNEPTQRIASQRTAYTKVV